MPQYSSILPCDCARPVTWVISAGVYAFCEPEVSSEDHNVRQYYNIYRHATHSETNLPVNDSYGNFQKKGHRMAFYSKTSTMVWRMVETAQKSYKSGINISAI